MQIRSVENEPRLHSQSNIYINLMVYSLDKEASLKELTVSSNAPGERLFVLVNEEMDGVAWNYREQLEVISEEIAGINGRLERLYDALETGKIGPDDLAPRIQQLRHQQEQLQSTKRELEALLSDRRVELADLETVTQCVDDLRSLLEESTLAERKSFISSFVKEVKVTGDEVLLTYTMPLPPEGISQERVGVLYSVHYGGDRGIRTPDLCHAKAALSLLSYIPTYSDYSICSPCQSSALLLY
jgi:hypothetical protein